MIVEIYSKCYRSFQALNINVCEETYLSRISYYMLSDKEASRCASQNDGINNVVHG